MAELRWAMDRGHKGAVISSFPNGSLDPAPEDDAFWGAAQEAAWPVAVHIGSFLPAPSKPPQRNPGALSQADGRYLITDAYAAEDAGFGDGTAPLWLIDREKSEKKTLVRMKSVTPPWADKLSKAKVMRVDFHPAWDRYTHTQVAFNGVQDGTRRVFVADLSEIVPSTA